MASSRAIPPEACPLDERSLDHRRPHAGAVDLAPSTDPDVKEPPTRFFQALRQIGPGLILAGSIVGTGELIATTGLGAEQGYILLWLILLSCVIKVFVQVELGRYAITHGKTTLAALDTLPGPRLGTSWLSWLWLIMMLATQAQIAAMEGLVGQAAHMAFPGGSAWVAATAGTMIPAWGTFLEGHPEYFWATLTGLAAIALLLSGGYKRLEHVTTALVAGVTLITVACVAGLPFTEYPVRWSEMKTGLTFALPATGIALAFSTFGITGVGASELFAYPYWCIEKGYARSVGPAIEATRNGDAELAVGCGVMQLDAWFSMVVFTVATVAFYLLGAAVLHPQGLDPQGAGMIATLAQMYVKPLGHVDARGVPDRRLGRAVQDALRRHRRQQPTHGRFPRPDWHLAVGRGEPVAGFVINAFCIFYPLLSLGIFYAVREPEDARHGRRLRAGR